ncbi:hypothetical protein [Morganella morganii]|uniref:hypothetical protein n=2 Tax=Morganella morganii TaxID=582 RepID=UPI001FFD8D9A|nr:hypothetical protein [Morganella morganii]
MHYVVISHLSLCLLVGCAEAGNKSHSELTIATKKTPDNRINNTTGKPGYMLAGRSKFEQDAEKSQNKLNEIFKAGLKESKNTGIDSDFSYKPNEFPSYTYGQYAAPEFVWNSEKQTYEVKPSARMTLTIRP